MSSESTIRRVVGRGLDELVPNGVGSVANRAGLRVGRHHVSIAVGRRILLGAAVGRPRARMSSKWWHGLACAVMASTLALACASQPRSLDARTATIHLADVEESVDVYRPVGPQDRGVVIVAHGWTRSRARHSDLGRALAEAGVTAVIPDLPNVMNLWGNGDAVVDLVEKLEAGALGLPPIDRSRIVLIGTSAGGLATVLASARLPGLAGWIGLDPVDRTGTGSAAAARVDSPAVVLLADPSGCNLFGSGRAIAGSLPKLLRTNVVEGASHCDFEAPTNNFCRVMCGGSSNLLQEQIRLLTVAASLELLALSSHR